MFEWDEGEKQWMAAHHPFTSPHEEDMSKLESGVESLNDPLSVSYTHLRGCVLPME